MLRPARNSRIVSVLLDEISIAQDTTLRATRQSPLFEEGDNESPRQTKMCDKALASPKSGPKPVTAWGVPRQACGGSGSPTAKRIFTNTW